MSTFVRPTWARFGRAALLGALVALFGAPAVVSAQSVADKVQQNHERQRNLPRARFSLQAEPAVVLEANQFQCGLLNSGETCTDIFDSPTGGGGFWPTGSPNQYMFNSGIMIAGIIPATAGFEWAGDTTGAYFFDALGTQQHGTPITNIYNSLDQADLAVWPDFGDVPGFDFATAYIVDEDIFSPVLTEGGPGGTPRAVGSQQDTWVMYWDGDPGLSANRDHPMGVAVEQRTMAWNFPAGNEATIYIFYKLTNVTDNPTFQALNEGRYGISLPDAGWRIDSIFMSYAADPDVTTDATENFASVILPFNMGITYMGTFVATEFSYPPSLFYPPFFTSSPGIIGVQYLKSPEDPATGGEVGLTMFSVTQNPGSCTGLCDPRGDKQLWRYLSGNVNPGQGDPSCTFADPQASRICFLPQVPADMRFFQASGPFSLDPGQSATIVVGSQNPPGIPSIQPGCAGNPILPIEVGAGWVSTPAAVCAATDPEDVLDLRQINVVPNSLLGRSQVAQAVFDGKFLLPFAPEPPEFVLVPGDGEVAVIWAPSRTETEGDPFFAAAQNPTTGTGDPNPLYNPNFRQFDVEGYRIYRSTDNANFELIAQFDYENTTFTDVRCESDRGFVPGEDTCPGTAVVIPINDVTDVNADFIADPFVLFGGASAQRLRLADGRTLAIAGDSATPGATPALDDTGVQFAFIDTDVVNNFRYFYQVRAFDINSTYSGPISLESSSETKSAIPQAAAPNQVLASFSQTITGDDDTPLDPTADLPTLNSETGTFSGPMPPTNGIEAAFVPLVPRLLGAFRVVAQIDSIVGRNDDDAGGCPAGENIQGSCWRMFLTYDVSGDITPSAADGWTPFYTGFGEPLTTSFSLGGAVVEADSATSDVFDVPEGFPGFTASLTGTWQQGVDMSWMEGQSNRRRGGCATGADCPRFMHGGPRWFDGANETFPDPTMYTGAGELAGIDTIVGGVSHTPRTPGGTQAPPSTAMQCFDFTGMHYGRAADVQFTWGATGFDEVRDITHNVDVTFNDAPRAGTYGFMTVPENDANGNGMIDWEDFNHLQSILGEAKHVGFCNAPGGSVDAADPDRFLSQTPEVTPVTTSYANAASITAGTQTGNGFGLYVNGDFYIFQLPAGVTTLPAAGTQWTLRTYAGRVRTTAENADWDATGYTFLSAIRPPNVPGLRVTFESEQATQLVGNADLRLVHAVPDPYYAQSRFDLSPVEKALRFVNLPAQATIRIYTVSGLLVDVLTHDDPGLGGMATWDLKNRSGQFVASGVYFFHVSTPGGDEHTGRFTVINSGIGQ